MQHTNRAYWGEIDGYRHTLELRLEFDATNLTSGISAGSIDLYYCGWDDAEYAHLSTHALDSPWFGGSVTRCTNAVECSRLEWPTLVIKPPLRYRDEKVAESCLQGRQRMVLE